MQSCLIIFFALWLQARPLATVSGQILDREGEPLAGVLITYKNVGTFDRDYRADPGQRWESPRMLEGTGRVYKVKSNRKGAFLMIGVDYGVYDIEMTGPDGSHIYSGRKTIVGSTEASSQNVLNVDLSLVTSGPLVPGSETNLAGGKKTKEQLALIHEENVHAVKINRLIVQYQNALAVEDWQGAIDLVKKLIALDANRWQFYQNLGRLQTNLMAYQDAAQSFAQGVEVAQKTLANPSDTDRALTNIGELLMSQADCYERLERIDEAVALYEKAAAVHPRPFMAHYRACSALTNRGKADAAIEECTQAIADDPAQWLPYQTLGGIFTTASKPQDALAVYEKGIAAAQNMLQAKPDAGTTQAGLGQMLNSQGNLLLQLKQYDDAIAAFTKATSVSALPATPYFNLCATYYNLKRGDEAIAACEHAILSDPTMPEAYYIKGAVLFGRGQLEHGRFVAPPGTLESLNQYLRYAASGQYAETVKDMINQLNGKN
ncbi:MAG: tetratricopeptide repeat protein [Acidobacteriia bacterium]|nr:tetratricopeptide repeat protein [Terriglobia bacterium]